jgi:hypothetical protein
MTSAPIAAGKTVSVFSNKFTGCRFLLLVACIFNTVSTLNSIPELLDLPDINIGQKDCCPLVWKKLQKIPSGYIVPRDAIIGGTNYQGLNSFYGFVKTSNPNYNHNLISIVEESDPNRAYTSIGYIDRMNVTEREEYYDALEGCFNIRQEAKKCGLKIDIWVLTNPNNCVIGWWKRMKDKESPLGTPDILFPEVNGAHFARYRVVDGPFGVEHLRPAVMVKQPRGQGLKKSRSIKNFYHYIRDIAKIYISYDLVQRTFNGIGNGLRKGSEVLYIDCAESASTVLNAELFHMKFVDPTFFQRKAEKGKKITLHSTSIINLSNVEQETNVKLSTSAFTRLTISADEEDTGYRKRLKFSHWGTELDKLINPNMYRSGRLKRLDLLDTFVETGAVSLAEKNSEYTFDQTIVEPPNSKTVVSIMTTPISASVKFSAGYRIKTPRLGRSNTISFDTIFNLMKRLSMAYVVEKHNRKDDYLVFWRNGTFSCDTGVNTHVKLYSHLIKLDKNGNTIEEKDKKLMEYEMFPFGNIGDDDVDSKYRCIDSSAPTTRKPTAPTTTANK